MGIFSDMSNAANTAYTTASGGVPPVDISATTTAPNAGELPANPLQQAASAAQNAYMVGSGVGVSASDQLDRLKLQEAIGVRKSAQAGGLDATLGYLDKTDPSAAADLRKKQQDYQNSIATGAGQLTQNKDAALKLEQDSTIFNANIYSKVKETMAQNPQLGAQLYEKALPILRKHDPDAPDTYDPQRADIALAQANTAQDKAKQDFERQTAQINHANELAKPQTELAKQQADMTNALQRGDYAAANDLNSQVQNTLFNQSSDRIKASNGNADTLRKEHQDLSKEYVQSRIAYGQAQTGLAANTPAGDQAGVLGMMHLINPAIQLQPGQLATAATAPGIAQNVIDMYNKLANGEGALSPQQRKDMLSQADQQFKAKDLMQQQLDQQYSGLAKSYGVDPKKVVVDFSPAASPFSPTQEAQISSMSDDQIKQMMSAAKAAGSPDAYIQQQKAAIDALRQRTQQVTQGAAVSSNVEQQLKKLAPKADPQVVKVLSQNTEVLQQYGINTPERQRAFAAQMAHESSGFTAMKENISDRAANKNYGGRMGNDEPGDGALYKGRGLIQLTGKDNYKTYGDKIGVNLIAHPQLAADPKIAVQIAAAYWQDHGLNKLADNGDIKGITKRINGGYNGLSSRQKYQTRADNLKLFEA